MKDDKQVAPQERRDVKAPSREVQPAQPQREAVGPTGQSNVIDAEFTEVAAPAKAPGLGQRFMDWVKDNHANQPSLGGQLAAIGREAVKDVRATMNETFFGQGEHPSEPGTPLNPTQQIVTQEMGNFHGYDAHLEGYIGRSTSREDREMVR